MCITHILGADRKLYALKISREILHVLRVQGLSISAELLRSAVEKFGAPHNVSRSGLTYSEVCRALNPIPFRAAVQLG